MASVDDAASQSDIVRNAFGECRIFVIEMNRIIEHARKEPLNDTWVGVYRDRVRTVAAVIDQADALVRKAAS